jgi:transposase
MRVVGMDIHRSFAQVAILDNGSIVHEPRVELIRDRFLKFAQSLQRDDGAPEIHVTTAAPGTAVLLILGPPHTNGSLASQ